MRLMCQLQPIARKLSTPMAGPSRPIGSMRGLRLDRYGSRCLCSLLLSLFKSVASKKEPAAPIASTLPGPRLFVLQRQQSHLCLCAPAPRAHRAVTFGFIVEVKCLGGALCSNWSPTFFCAWQIHRPGDLHHCSCRPDQAPARAKNEQSCPCGSATRHE